MLDLAAGIDAEFRAALARIPNESLGPATLCVHDVLRAHFLVANHFYLLGEGMGGVGPRDDGLLQSAVYRQVASFRGRLKWQNLFDVCATLFFGLIKDHPFHDANKRTAFLSLLYQLYDADWCPTVSERQLEDFTVEVSDGRLSRYPRYQSLVKDGDPDPEIKFISWYLRKNTRKIDKRFYAITFNQLQKILNGFGFALANPHGNYIDIVRVETKKAFLGVFGSEREVQTKLGQIGFPRWTEEVGKSALKTAREVTKLTHKDGVDSASFYQGVDTLQSLITSYHEPLMRLAVR